MEEQLRVRKKEVLSSLRVPKGWVAIRQDLEAVEHKTKSGIFIPKSAAIDDADVRARLKDDEVHPYSGIVVASGIEDVEKGDRVLISKVCHDNYSAHIKFAGEIFKLIRVGDILSYVKEGDLYE